MVLDWLTKIATSLQNLYKLNGKPVYVLVESRESDK